jgi:hypothetical protein
LRFGAGVGQNRRLLVGLRRGFHAERKSGCRGTWKLCRDWETWDLEIVESASRFALNFSFRLG